MSDAAETILPAIAIVGSMSIPILWFYFDSRNKASRDKVIGKALESGTPIDEVKEMLSDRESERSAVRRMPYRKGLILMAIGFGLFISERMEFFHNDAGPMAGFGIIGMCLGFALLVSDIFNRNRF